MGRLTTSKFPFKGPLFIVGMPRSGTKLLRELLNRHAQISIAKIETEFLPAWAERWYTYGNLEDRNNFRKFYSEAVKLPYFIYQREMNRLITEALWYEGCNEYSVQGVFEALLRHDLDVPKKSGIIWGDKSPSYIRHIHFLAKLFPTAKFIHIVRDVRDYVASMQKAWHKHPLRAAQRWADDVQRTYEAMLSLGEKGLEIRYEDLLEDPRAVLEKICNFLEVGFDDRMMWLDEPTENLGDAKGIVGIVKDNKAKYKDRLPADQLRKVEEIAGETMIIYGYAPVLALAGLSHRLPKWKMRAYQLLDGIGLIRSETNERGLFGAICFHWRSFLSSGNRH